MMQANWCAARPCPPPLQDAKKPSSDKQAIAAVKQELTAAVQLMNAASARVEQVG